VPKIRVRRENGRVVVEYVPESEQQSGVAPQLPVAALSAEKPEEIRAIEMKPRLARLPSEQRQLELYEAERAKALAPLRTATARAVLELPGADTEQIARRAAELYSRFWAHPALLVPPDSPADVKAAAEQVSTGKKLLRGPITALQKVTDFLSFFSPVVRHRLLYPDRPISEAFKVAWERVKTGEDPLAGKLVPVERLPQRMPQWLKRAVAASPDLALDILLDPTTYLGVGLVTRGVKLGTQALKAATRAEELARAAGKLVTQAAEASIRREAAEKALSEASKTASQLARRAEKLRAAEEAAMARYTTPSPEALERYTRGIRRQTTKLEKTQKALEEVRQQVQALAEKQASEGLWGREAQRLEHLMAKLEKLKEAEKRLEAARFAAENEAAAARAKEFTKALRLRSERADVERQLQELRARLSSHEAEVRKQARAEEGLRKRYGEVVAGERAAYELPERYLGLQAPWGGRVVPLARVEPLVRQVEALGVSVAAHVPALRKLHNLIVQAGVLKAPLIREGMTPEEYRAAREMREALYHRMSTAGPKALETARRESMAKYAGLPPNARKAASYVEEMLVSPAEAEEVLRSIPEELRPYIQRARELWSATREEYEKKLAPLFGEDWEERLIPYYVPHVLVGPLDKRQQVLKMAAEEPEKFLEEFKDAAQRAMRRRPSAPTAAGAKPWLVYRRTIPTLEVLQEFAKKYGLRVVDDIGTLDALYRYAAERALNLKETSDWLERLGWIRPASAAGRDWVDASKVFPWYRESGMKLHPEAVRLFEQVQKPLLNPAASEEFRELARAYDTAMGLFKGAVTSMRPSFHLINTLGNMVLMRMAGIRYPEQVKALGRAVSILTGAHPEADTIMRWFREDGLEGMGMFADTRRVSERLVQQIEDYMDRTVGGFKGKLKAVLWPRAASTLERVTGMAAARHFGEFEDTLMRLAAYTHFLEKGMTREQAARLVRAYMGDYRALTPTERWSRHWIMPFYTWAKFAAGRSLSALLTQPGAFTGYQHLVNAFDRAGEFDRDVLPPYLRWAVVLEDADGGKVLFINPQPPWQMLFTLASEPMVKGSGVGEAGRELTSSLSPFAQAAADVFLGGEIGADVGLEGAPYRPSSPELQRLWEVLGKSDTPPQVAQLLWETAKRFLPVWELQKLYPEYVGAPLQTVGRAVTGAKGFPIFFLSTFDVPLAQARNIASAKRLLDQYYSFLEAQGRVPVDFGEKLVPAAESLVQQVEKRRTALEALREVMSDPFKLQVASLLVAHNKDVVTALGTLVRHADLLTGTNDEVVQKLRKLFNMDNYNKLKAYLGREPNVSDFLEHRSALEEGTLRVVPLQLRKVERLLEELELFQMAK
jgi:hypothetical protein